MTGEDIVQYKNFLQKLEDASMIMAIHGTCIELLDKNTKKGKHLNTRWTCLDYPKHNGKWWEWL